MFNDDTIKKLAENNSLITPFNEEQLQPHSFDCLLGEEIKYPIYNPTTSSIGWDDSKKETYIINHFESRSWNSYNLKSAVVSSFRLDPLKFALGGTIEYFKLPQDVVGFVQGKSTIGRNGLQIECAGLIDAGFEGNITLEFFNMAPWPIDLFFKQKICQVHFVYVDSPMHKDYQKIGHYNKQTGATAPIYAI